MIPDAAFTIARHAVPRGEDGLSPLQARILQDPAPVRVFSAPTGAGKSHAFIHAAVQGKRVLFVVPTRRLAQNLAQDAAGELEKRSIRNAVGVWSSDAAAERKRQDPAYRPWQARVRQVSDIDGTRFIVATPESVALMLLRYAGGGPGTSPFGLSDLGQYFDHIVFDEFHSIDPRGFGLCALVARLCVVMQDGPRATFLSATPIAILPVLAALGVPEGMVGIGAETVEEQPPPGNTPGLRVLHGDVRVAFVPEPDMVALLEAHATDVQACIGRGSQCVVILDSLAELHARRTEFAALFARLGVPPSRRLAINSIDDNASDGQDGLFIADRGADPSGFDVLLATSSVEMGVTFRAGMLAMDPGHDALSFVQRVGRVARRDEPGLVLVRRDPTRDSRRSWLRNILADLPREPEAPLSVSRFLDIVLRATRTRFDAPVGTLDTDTPPTEFRAMPQRAVWASCLFWHALERGRPRHLAGQREMFKSLVPAKVGVVASLLKTVAGGDGPESSHFGAEWARLFLKQAETLRDIAPTVVVKEPDRTLDKVPMDFIDRFQDLRAYPLIADDRGGWILVLDRPLQAILGGATSEFAERKRTVLLPNGQSHTFPAVEAVSRAVAEMLKVKDAPGTTSTQSGRLAAAIKLVSLSGLIPGTDEGNSVGGAAVL